MSSEPLKAVRAISFKVAHVLGNHIDNQIVLTRDQIYPLYFGQGNQDSG